MMQANRTWGGRLSLCLLIIGLLILCPAQAVSGASVTVASSTSSSAILATYACDGVRDEVELQDAVARVSREGGGDVELSDGTFHLDATLILAPGVNLVGAGARRTELTFLPDLQFDQQIAAQGNNRIADFALSGAGHIQIRASDVACDGITARVEREAVAPGAFYVMAEDEVIENVSFTDCHAIDCDTYGFLIDGDGSPRTVRNVLLSGCTAINCGRYDRPDSFVVGFDLAERADIDGMVVENCRAEGNWESGFHFEWRPSKRNVTLRDCASRNNAQKYWSGGAEPTFGAGFFASHDIQLFDCVSEANYRGFWLLRDVTATRCTDTGSVQAFTTETGEYVALRDCSSTKAGEWALNATGSKHVRAENFRVTDPVGNPYPALRMDGENVTVNLASNSTSRIPTATSRFGVVVALAGVAGAALLVARRRY